jgi:hypothetical protein
MTLPCRKYQRRQLVGIFVFYLTHRRHGEPGIKDVTTILAYYMTFRTAGIPHGQQRTSAEFIEKDNELIVDKTAPTLFLSPQDGDYYGGRIRGKYFRQHRRTKPRVYPQLRRGDDPTQWTELTRGTILPASSQLFSWKVGVMTRPRRYVHYRLKFRTNRVRCGFRALIVDNTPPVVSISSPGRSFITAETDIREMF